MTNRYVTAALLAVLINLSCSFGHAKTDTSTTYLSLAKAAFKKNNLDEAEEHIEQAKNNLNRNITDTNQAEVYHWLGLIMDKQAGASSLFSAMGYAKNSLKGYLKSVALEPENILYREALVSFYLNAPGFAGGDIDKAITHAQIILKQSTNSGYKILFDCYAKAGEPELVLSTYEKSIKEYPLDVEFPYKIGVYWWLEKRYEKAVKAFDLSLSLSAIGDQQKAIHLWSLYYIGRISLKTEKHLVRGINAYQKLIKVYDDESQERVPSIEWVTYRMANLMALNRQEKNAKTLYLELLGTTSDSDLIQRLNNKL